MTPVHRVLVVDDEKLIRWSLQECLSKEGYLVSGVEDAHEALRLLNHESFDLALVDYKLPDMDGLRLLAQLRERQPGLPILIMTAHSSLENAVAAMRAGASDYLTKPFQDEDLLLRLAKALENSRLRRAVDRQQEENARRFSLQRIIGESEEMRKVKDLVARVVRTGDATILLWGESGTGKDVMARAIHYNSPRGDGPFVNITCTAIPESLLESILFGHEKGAFTDAKAQKKGMLEEADGGSVFLDEIGDMSLYLQGKILRFLEDRTIRRVGGGRDIHLDVRVLAATNKDLRRLVNDGRFREDLYFRLKVIPILMPPLRDRQGDVPLLVDHFIAEFNAEFKKRVQGISPRLLRQLEEYLWPGNIRELKNTIERAMILGTGDMIDGAGLPLALLDDAAEPVASASTLCLTKKGIRLEELEEDLVRQALALSRGNQTRAGQYLGLNRDQIRYRIEKFGIDVRRYLER